MSCYDEPPAPPTKDAVAERIRAMGGDQKCVQDAFNELTTLSSSEATGSLNPFMGGGGGFGYSQTNETINTSSNFEEGCSTLVASMVAIRNCQKRIACILRENVTEQAITVNANSSITLQVGVQCPSGPAGYGHPGCAILKARDERRDRLKRDHERAMNDLLKRAEEARIEARRRAEEERRESDREAEANMAELVRMYVGKGGSLAAARDFANSERDRRVAHARAEAERQIKLAESDSARLKALVRQRAEDFRRMLERTERRAVLNINGGSIRQSTQVNVSTLQVKTLEDSMELQTEFEAIASIVADQEVERSMGANAETENLRQVTSIDEETRQREVTDEISQVLNSNDLRIDQGGTITLFAETEMNLTDFELSQDTVVEMVAEQLADAAIKRGLRTGFAAVTDAAASQANQGDIAGVNDILDSAAKVVEANAVDGFDPLGGLGGLLGGAALSGLLLLLGPPIAATVVAGLAWKSLPAEAKTAVVTGVLTYIVAAILFQDAAAALAPAVVIGALFMVFGSPHLPVSLKVGVGATLGTAGVAAGVVGTFAFVRNQPMSDTARALLLGDWRFEEIVPPEEAEAAEEKKEEALEYAAPKTRDD